MTLVKLACVVVGVVIALVIVMYWADASCVADLGRQHTLIDECHRMGRPIVSEGRCAYSGAHGWALLRCEL